MTVQYMDDEGATGTRSSSDDMSLTTTPSPWSCQEPDTVLGDRTASCVSIDVILKIRVTLAFGVVCRRPFLARSVTIPTDQRVYCLIEWPRLTTQRNSLIGLVCEDRPF